MNAPTTNPAPSPREQCVTLAHELTERADKAMRRIGAAWDRMDTRDRDVIARAAGQGPGFYLLAWADLPIEKRRSIVRGATRCARIARELLETP